MKKEINITQETMNSSNCKFDFTVFRPGGNDTCLVLTPEAIPSSNERRIINDFIQQVYPNVEQVGFVKANIDTTKSELMMAGGEFCGNATRSAAWLLLQGKSGEITMQVSGVEEKLKAGITITGEAFAQMPIYKEISRITKDNDQSYIVEMEGITHYVDFESSSIQRLSPEEVKVKAMTKIKEKGLDAYPAAGVIYATKNADSLRIDPVVYVRDINTLYYETACGSGTTALGLVLALEKGESINNVSVIQPSDLVISISVNFDGKIFKSAQIQGQVETLNSGNLEIGEDISLITEKIDNQKKLKQVFSDSNLISLYKDIFSKAPYFENFTSQDIEEYFTEYVNDGILFVAKNNKEIIGFGAALPISSVPEISQILEKAGKDTTNGWYMADLGVKDDFRRKKVGQKLVKLRLNAFPKESPVFMRTSINNLASQALYKSIGFQQIPDVFQEVEQARVSGEIKKDKRIFLEKKL